MKRIHIFCIVLVSLIQGCSGKPFINKPAEDRISTGSNIVFVISHDWHTGFIISSTSSEAVMPFLKERFPNTEYYEFGWGDKGFYQAQEITSGLTIQAIFWPTESVMHVVAVPYEPDIYFKNSEIIELTLSDSELNSLLTFINMGFYRDHRQQVAMEKSGIYGDSQFYTGEGDYYLFNTCNKWTAKGLASAGFDISTAFKLSASSIMSYLEAHPGNTSTTSTSRLDFVTHFCS